jgi:hypothetical protein
MIKTYLKLAALVSALVFLAGCGKKGQIVESCDRELALCETEAFIPDNNFGLLTSFEGDDIVVAQLSDGAVLSKIPIAFDEYRVFLSMIDENEGYLLYCSTPGAGQMMKILYFTKDRWNSYTEADISLKIDGYPTSLSAMSKEQLFIGTQMRSNGFLFETTDGGRDWISFTVDGSVQNCQNGYAPIVDQENDIAYVLLKCGENYLLYQLNDVWEKKGSFPLDTFVEEFFASGGELYIVDDQGRQFRIE